MKNNIAALILAAGKGSRLNTQLPKPLLPVDGIPMIVRIISVLEELKNIDIKVVVGYKAKIIKEKLNRSLTFIHQNETLGTGHAVKQATNCISEYEDIIILTADSPNINKQLITHLIRNHHISNAGCSFLTSDFPFRMPYGRVIRKQGNVTGCIEEINANSEQLKIKELFTSHYIIKTGILLKYIDYIKPDKLTKEYNLTEIINILIKEKININPIKTNNYKSVMGINNIDDLKLMESWLKEE